MALDADLLETQKTLDRYSNAFDDTYGPVARTYIADSYRSDDHDIELAGVESLLLSGQDLLVLGPSGCGKSLLATCLAHRLLGQGVVPIVIECKLFDGALGGVLQQEAVLLEMHSAPALIAAARRLSRPILLVADGYNECQEGTRVRLTRTLRAASIRYDAMILVTFQVDVARSDLLQLQSVIVDRPGGELKERIAGVDAASHSSLSHLLDTVATGFEANLVGQVGRELRKHSSRFALFDYFARRKLGDMATDGIRLSCAIAKQLLDRLTFSLSVREVDRISAAAGAPTSALQQLGHAGVLSVRGDRVSFGHEIYVHAFAAEAILREKGTDAGAIATALAEPRYASARTFLAGAIDDDDLLTAVVSLVADRALLEACLLGECGSAARRLVSEEVDCVLSRLTAEAASLRFSVTADGWWNVELDARYVAAWSQRDLALVSTLSVGMAEGQWINQVLETLKILDSTLAEEFRRLRPTAAAKAVNIRSRLFAITYTLPRDKTGLCHLVNTLHNGSLVSHRRRSTEAFTVALHAAWPVVETPGQLYVALSLCRLVPYERKAHFAPYVLPFLQGERWSRLPYHVHLDLLDFVHALYDLPEHLRNEYVDALQALLPDLHPFMTQTAVEALQRFGALQVEEEEQTEAVREEIRAVLSRHAPENAAQRAWGIYNAQFDHPLAGAYVQALEELPASDLRRLQMLACEGAEVGSFF